MGSEKPVNTMVDQFNNFREVKKRAKMNTPKGPVDLKAARQVLVERNKKNRMPS